MPHRTLLLLAVAGCTAVVDSGENGDRLAAPDASGGSGSGGMAAVTGSAGSDRGAGGVAGDGSSSVGDDAAATGGSDSGQREARLDAGSDARVVSAGDAGLGGPSLCAAGKYTICEDFESTAEGAVPAGWTKHGAATVAADQAARGKHSLKIAAAASGERRIYVDATRLGSGHWGRIFYRVELPVPTVFVHSTMVGLEGVGPTRGNEEVRVVDTVKDASGKHQFLYNVQPSGSEFGKGSPYNWTFDGKWHCAEWHIDAPTQSYHFYFDGTEVTSIAVNNGPGKYDGSDIPISFTQVHVGWNNYQSAAPGFVAWIDEVALDANRIGCGN